MTKSWVFDFVEYPRSDGPPSFDPQIAAGALDRHFAKWMRAEALGFEGVFLSEHHFTPGALAPSPNILLAGLAARTRTLRMGVLAQVLPLYPAHRVAEECALLDIMSHGRLEIGVARGLGFVDTDRLGMPREEARQRFEEALDILVMGLTRPTFSYEGRFNRFTDLTISPKPLQQPRPPIWQTVRTRESAAAAGRRGFRVCGAYEAPEEMAEVFDAYREAYPGATADDVGIRRNVFVGETEAEAEALCFESLRLESQKYRGPAAHLGELVLSGADAIWGTPARVAEEIGRQMQITGAGHILTALSSGYSAEGMQRSLELYGAEVIPRLQRLAVPAH